MKRRFLFGLAVMVALCAVAQVGAAEEYRILAEDLPVEEYVRLHILANSDSEEDQALKLKVRDAVLDCARELLGDTCSADDAYAILGEKISLVEACARQAAEDAGFFGEVRAQVGVFEFPDRQYGDLLVPAGEYRAVRVLLGAGEGHNWWCVIYPTLCAIDEKGEFVQERAEIVFYSSIGRWLRSTLGGGQ